MKRKKGKWIAVLAGVIVFCWIFVDTYHRLVILTQCDRVSWEGYKGNHVIITGGLEERTVAEFSPTGAGFTPWFFWLTFAPGPEAIKAVRLNKKGGKFQMLSVDLSYGNGRAYRQNLGRIDEECWATLTQYLDEVSWAGHIEQIDEREGTSWRRRS